MSDTTAEPDLEVFAIVRSDNSVDVWLDPAKPGIKHVRADTVQAQMDEARLRETLHDLITEQSEGEWDDKTINTDVEVFLTAILALLRKGGQP